MYRISLYSMVLLYLLSGINHFIHPEPYVKIMPTWLPYHDELVFISGVCEMLLAILLLFPSTRQIAAWGIILLLIAVFPANIQMTINYYREENPYAWVTVIRLLLQPVLIFWSYRFTRVIEHKEKEYKS
ncbi:MAG: DoxX family protein [Flavisolibacter sp.]